MSEETKEYTVYWQVTLRGAVSTVYAESKEEARIAALEELGFDLSSAELIDWQIERVKEE